LLVWAQGYRVNPEPLLQILYVKTRRWECDRPGVQPTSSGLHVWGQYHSSEKVSCDEWYWNPSPDISRYMCEARRVVRGLLLTTLHNIQLTPQPFFGKIFITYNSHHFSNIQLTHHFMFFQVEDFEVSVAGMGSLVWPGATDLRGLVTKIDSLVKFGQHEVRSLKHKKRAWTQLPGLTRVA